MELNEDTDPGAFGLATTGDLAELRRQIAGLEHELTQVRKQLTGVIETNGLWDGS